MIFFKEKTLDRSQLVKLAERSLYDTINQIAEINANEYREMFGGHKVRELKTALAQISYAKNYQIEGLSQIDDSSDFHVYVTLYIYVINEDGCKEIVSTYKLMLNAELNIVDDFFT